MKRLLRFYKLYLAEMLFVFVTLLCIVLAINGMICYKGWVAGLMVVSVIILQAFAGYYIQKPEKPDAPLSFLFTAVWYICFICMALSWIICSIMIYPTEKLIFYILLEVSLVAFVAMFGHLIIVSDRPDCKTYADD